MDNIWGMYKTNAALIVNNLWYIWLYMGYLKLIRSQYTRTIAWHAEEHNGPQSTPQFFFPTFLFHLF
jgi:hypothetical protein